MVSSGYYTIVVNTNYKFTPTYYSKIDNRSKYSNDRLGIKPLIKLLYRW